MKPRKIKRRKIYTHKNRYRKRASFPWKPLGMVCLLAALMVGGIFTAKWMADTPSHLPEPLPSSPVGSSDPTDPTDPTNPVETPPEEVPVLSVDRAFYAPTERLRDPTTCEPLLRAAAKAGFGAVIFDLKDADGYLLYASQTPLSAKAKSVSEQAMTKEELAQLQALCAKQGITPIPRVYAFYDIVGAENLPTARVMYAQNPAWLWHDWYPNQGGRPWLNAYSPEAQDYILGLVEELKGQGFTHLMLDKVQFPEKTYDAYFGNYTISRGEVLTQFVKKAKTAFGDGQLMLAAPTPAVIGSNTAAFGDNPLNFGADTVTPYLFLSELGKQLKVGDTTIRDTAKNPQETMQLVYDHLCARVQLMPQPPKVQVWLNEPDAVPQGVSSFVLYEATGTYDFSRWAS